MTSPPRKPFWKRKRWIAAAVLWPMLACPLGFCLISYADGRHWVPLDFYEPLRAVYFPCFTKRGNVRSELQPAFQYFCEMGER